MIDKLLARIAGDERERRDVFSLTGQRIRPQNILNAENEFAFLSTIQLLRLMLMLCSRWMGRCRVDHPRLSLPAAIIAVFKHVVTGRIKGPKCTLTRPSFLPRDFDEAIVQT